VTAGGSSIPAVQRLLSALAAGRRCAEAGTAFGGGAAAMAATASSLVTVELDEERAVLARARLAGLDNVELLIGDWRDQLPPRAPYELLFLDGGGYKQSPEETGPRALELLAEGGLLVIDDLTPGSAEHDPARAFLLNHPGLAAAEVLTTSETAAIVAAVLPRR
jgi:predicted O-methyltransferase YrrM